MSVARPSTQPLGTIAPIGAFPAPVRGGSAPAPLAAARFLADAFRRGEQTLDDIEGPAGGGRLPTSLETDPAGGGVRPTGPTGLPTLRDGARGAAVERLQRALAAQGFDPGGVDGAYGDNTKRAVVAFQRARGLAVDGVAGPATWAALGAGSSPVPAPAPSAPAAPGAAGTRGRLMGQVHNRYKGRRHQCFRYAWTLVAGAGGRGIGAAPQSRAGRGQGTAAVAGLVASGEIRPGDVIYVNKRPGADPSSTNLAFGPHWFVYMGNGQFADQYGIRDAQAMAAFVPGRKIDTIYHTMGV